MIQISIVSNYQIIFMPPPLHQVGGVEIKHGTIYIVKVKRKEKNGVVPVYIMRGILKYMMPMYVMMED